MSAGNRGNRHKYSSGSRYDRPTGRFVVSEQARTVCVSLFFRRHVAVHELRDNSVHRVQRHPSGLGRAHIANTISHAG